MNGEKNMDQPPKTQEQRFIEMCLSSGCINISLAEPTADLTHN